LKGWKLSSSAKSSGKQYVFSGDNFVEAKSYLVIKRSESGLVLTNEGGTAKLAWSEDKIISEAIYGSAKEGKSYAYINSIWQWSDAPTPGAPNLLKSLAVSNLKAKENTANAAEVSKNTDDSEINNEEDETSNTNLVKLAVAKNTAFQPVININIEDFLNQLISEKVDNAILKANAGGSKLQDKIPATNNISEGDRGLNADKALDCQDFCLKSDIKITENSKNIRNNPWFYGDLVLSMLSLFLVWRYQELKKQVKN
jgi:hypothetical protein